MEMDGVGVGECGLGVSVSIEGARVGCTWAMLRWLFLLFCFFFSPSCSLLFSASWRYPLSFFLLGGGASSWMEWTDGEKAPGRSTDGNLYRSRAFLEPFFACFAALLLVFVSVLIFAVADADADAAAASLNE